MNIINLEKMLPSLFNNFGSDFDKKYPYFIAFPDTFSIKNPLYKNISYI